MFSNVILPGNHDLTYLFERYDNMTSLRWGQIIRPKCLIGNPQKPYPLSGICASDLIIWSSIRGVPLSDLRISPDVWTQMHCALLNLYVKWFFTLTLDNFALSSCCTRGRTPSTIARTRWSLHCRSREPSM